MSLQLGRLGGLPALREVQFGRYDYDGRRPDLAGDEARLGELTVADPDVDALLDQIGDAIRDENLDAHVRVAPKELREPRHDAERPEARGNADSHAPGGCREAAPDPRLGGV